MQKERSTTPLNSDSPAASGSDRSAGDRDELCRRLLVVLARTQAAPGAAPDAEVRGYIAAFRPRFSFWSATCRGPKASHAD
jgi:hypothetical protein